MKKILLVVMAVMMLCFGCSGSKEETIDDGELKPEEEEMVDVGVFDLESQTVKLNDGNIMPVIGLGTWTLSNEEAEESVYHALKCGMRLIDTARYYRCEVGVGRGHSQGH